MESSNINPDIYDTATIIFTMSRMNPPTPGHLFLIQKLIEEGVKNNVDKVYVILSKTNDNNEDPISCENKIDVLGNINDLDSMTVNLKKQMINNENDTELREKIQNINVLYQCVKPEQKSPFSPLFDIIYSYPENQNLNLVMIIGDDRKNLLDSVADTFLFKNDRIKSFNGIVLDRPNMGKYKNMSREQLENLDISSVPLGAFSASFVRNLVKYDLKDQFFDVYKNYIDEYKIDQLYEQIKEGLLMSDKKSKDSSKTPILKYKYPLIKGTQNYEITVKNKTLKRKRDDISGGKKINKLKKNKKTLKSKGKSKNKNRKSKKKN
jgi:nicotinic acid mononucleotide adenylyltransferase